MYIIVCICNGFLPTSLKHLLKLAKRYEVLHLTDLCEKELLSKLEVENAIEMLLLADEYGSVDFKGRCLTFIHDNFVAVRKTDGWGSLKESSGSSKYSALVTEMVEFNWDFI